MAHSLTLIVQDDVYEPLLQTAQETGHTPEELVSEWLSRAMRLAADDPVEEFIGMIETGLANWPDDHDLYIGAALMEIRERPIPYKTTTDEPNE